MTGYVVLVQNLWNAGLLAETERRIAEATAYAHERDLDIYLDTPGRARLPAARPCGAEWEAAEAGLRGLSATAGTGGDPRTACPSCPGCSCAAAPTTRRRSLDRAVDYARRGDARYELAPALMARIELAWLTGGPPTPRDAVELLAARTGGAGRRAATGGSPALAAPARAPGRAVPRLPAGVRGRAARATGGPRPRAFAERGAPYEQALELADSGEVEPTLEALRMLDELGARPAAALLRRRLRERGVTPGPARADTGRRAPTRQA